MKLILECSQSPGDVVVMTAAVRDLHAAFPGEYVTDVRTPCPALWENNPHVTPIEDGDPDARHIPMHYPLIQQSNATTAHFLDGFREYLGEQLGRTIRRGPARGDIHLSAAEHAAPCVVELLTGNPVYWLIVSGGKRDFTAKVWDPARWQAVVNHFRGRIQFVQVGEAGHDHPALAGVVDLRGRTNLRELVNLVHRASGVLCPVTALMHLAAAVPRMCADVRPCVVVAGGREPVQWERYPGHTFLDTIGKLPCCASGGCWKSRVVPLGDGHDESLCVRPVEIRPGVNLPACLDMITAADVIRAVESYLAQPPPERSVPPPEKPCCAGGAPAAVPGNNPAIWGPGKWAELHARPDALPADFFQQAKLDRQRAETAWLEKYRASLPCDQCRADFDGLLAELPPVYDDREAYFTWTVGLHNVVNRRLGKPAFPQPAAAMMREWNNGTAARRGYCGRCEHFQRATAHTGPTCALARTLVKPLIARGSCPAGNWKLPALPADSAGVGLVIGTFAAVPYIHAQLESRRRFHPEMPCLVVDDGSDKGEELRALCVRYGAELIVRPRRLNHARGDMDTFVQGHAWADARGVRLLVKFSQRWLPVAPWAEALLALSAETGAATFNNHCVFHHFGFRSECVAMDVDAWRAHRALAPVLDMLARTADQPGDCGVGAGGVLVEGVIHQAAGIAATGRPAESGGNYARWAWMGESRAVAQPGILWHESHSAGAYHAQLQRWGIFDYALADFINPAANLHG